MGERPRQRETREEAMFSRLVDAAEKFASEYEGDNHIWQALTSVGIREESERIKMRSKIKAELKRRAAAREQKEAEYTEALADDKRERTLKQAAELAATHPVENDDDEALAAK